MISKTSHDLISTQAVKIEIQYQCQSYTQYYKMLVFLHHVEATMANCIGRPEPGRVGSGWVERTRGRSPAPRDSDFFVLLLLTEDLTRKCLCIFHDSLHLPIASGGEGRI